MGIPYPLQSVWTNLSCAPQKTKAELLGLVKGILADGAIVEAEARFLLDWIRDHDDMRHEWPCSVLFSRLEVMLADGVLDADEQGELLRTLLDFVALRTAAQQPKASPCAPLPHVSLDAPYDEPCPTIDYVARRFVVTGDFACAKRPDVVSRIEQLGGDVSNSVSKKINFLIVGSLGNELWKAQGYGTKLEKAVALRNDGAQIRIVGEKHWFESLPT